jgi:hypothetical protein
MLEPQSLRRIGTVGIIIGLVGLAFSLVLALLVLTGASEPPQTIMAFWVPIQSIVNVAIGWNLRRQAQRANT